MRRLGALLTTLGNFKGGVEAYVDAAAEGGELWGGHVEDSVLVGEVAGVLGGTTAALRGL